MEAPSILHALPSQTIFDFLSQWHNKLCHSSQTLWTIIFWPNDQTGN